MREVYEGIAKDSINSEKLLGSVQGIMGEDMEVEIFLDDYQV